MSERRTSWNAKPHARDPKIDRDARFGARKGGIETEDIAVNRRAELAGKAALAEYSEMNDEEAPKYSDEAKAWEEVRAAQEASDENLDIYQAQDAANVDRKHIDL